MCTMWESATNRCNPLPWSWNRLLWSGGPCKKGGKAVRSIDMEEISQEQPRPLWSAEVQHARLEELLTDDPEKKFAPLRRDVRSLGRLLGWTLKEQADPSLYDTVEAL